MKTFLKKNFSKILLIVLWIIPQKVPAGKFLLESWFKQHSLKLNLIPGKFQLEYPFHLITFCDSVLN